MAEPTNFEITDCYPIELHYIKALFVQGQYRQCIQACRDVVKLAGGSLDHDPLQKTFVSLYLGMAHDDLARMMHHNSVAKMPAFNAAEQYYLDALEALPSPNEAAAIIYLRKLDVMRQEEAREEDAESDFVMSPSIAARDSFDLLSVRSSSPTFFSPTRPHRFSITSPAGTTRTASSEFDDLESHDSFSELLTPKRVLQRDFSRMSLLDDPPAQAKALSRDISSMSLIAKPSPRKSTVAAKALSRDVSRMSLIDQPSPRKPKGMSQGLMRQIRPGDTPKPYYVPPRLPYSGTGAHLRSRLPQLARRSKTEPMLSSPPSTHPNSPRPMSPVSPLSQGENNFELSDASTVSAESPHTPVRSSHLGSSVYMTANEGYVESAATYRLQDHLRAMAEQLRTHIDQVQISRDHLLRVQAEKRMARKVPTTGTPLAPIAGGRDCFSSPLQPAKMPTKTAGLTKARSFWSFVPQDVKVAEMKKRVQDGRDRKWERKRFDPTKYQDLCEKALEEL